MSNTSVIAACINTPGFLGGFLCLNVHCRPDYEACAAVAESVLSTRDCGAAHCVLGTAQPQSSSDFFALTGAHARHCPTLLPPLSPYLMP